ncbi:MAG TPA: hypothetical protein VG223_17795, partial [Solirubrobacteraceae bacterium]|nr:hypothetical protein [Solirubrobacteraceae bacterium]
MRRAVVVALTLGLLATAPAGAGAQIAPYSPYAPQTPTKGALYTDGQSGRWLLGGQWLYRPDPGHTGLAQGFWRDVASTAGWSDVTVPNADNA